MAYHESPYLFLFLPMVLLAYQLTPQRKRWVTLLIAGYVFFWSISGKILLYLIVTSLLTHYIGVWITLTKQDGKQAMQSGELTREESQRLKKDYKNKEKHILILGIVLLLSSLVYLKYYNFFADNVNSLLCSLKLPLSMPIKRMAIPIGISFYTLQAIGYMADVYWGKLDGRQHPGKIALFLGFFPQIMEGPISLYSQTADQLFEGKSLKYENLVSGGVRIFWGLFKKMIIADRLFLAVKTLYCNYTEYHGAMIAVAAVAYTLQLYMEFSGCMDIIIGSGKMFGITLPENFNQPFASKSAAEFWRRWHMTLGVWFKTYIFYPMSVSKLVKKWNKYSRKHCSPYITKLGISALCLFPVWLMNGLWHGARWSYIFYGMYYFVILLAEVAVEPVRDRLLKLCHISEKSIGYGIFQTLKTWLIIFTGELFFRADTLKQGFSMFISMFKGFSFRQLGGGALLELGLDFADLLAVGVGLAVVLVVGIIKERNLLGEEGINRLRLPVRWAVYYALILSVLIFGAYGAGYQPVDLIYAGF